MSVHQYYFRADSPEKIVRVIRQHPIILIANLSFGIALFVIGLIGIDIVSSLDFLNSVPDTAVTGVVIVYFVIAALVLYAGWFIYSRTEVIITEQHLVDVDQKTLFARNVSQLEIFKVQDVTAARNGILQTVLDYGTVTVQTAGEHEYFALENLPHPDKITEDFVTLFPKRGGVDALAESAPSSKERRDSPFPQPSEPPAAESDSATDQ